MKRVHVLSAIAFPLAVLLLSRLPAVSADEAGAAVAATAPETSALDRARALEDEIAGAIEKVRPSVTAILVEGEAEGGHRLGQGSGVVVDARGYVLTNWHVAGWASHITVVMAGSRRYPATLVGQDEEGDLALLKIEGEDPFPAVELGDSDRLRIGQWVLAMGNPRSVSEDGRATVTWGSVTALHAIGGGLSGRELFYGDSIQTDAELNPGNSGGPLFDLSGRLIGINGRIASGTRVPQGAVNANVGFAIAVNQIRRFLPLLRRGEPVRHGYLGVRCAEVAGGGPGVEIVVVAEDSAAARAGLRAGDRLLAVDGEAITSPVRLTNLVSSRPAGTAIAVRLLRDGEQVIRPVTLGARTEGDR